MANLHPNLANLRPFPKGVSGNPGGKPAAVRNRLQARFLSALVDDFETHGDEAIQAARASDPVGYLKLVASVIPKEFTVASDRPVEMLTDAELQAIILDGMRLQAVDGELAEAE